MLCFRREEAQIQQIEDEERRLEERKKDLSKRELEAAAHEDVKEYLKRCKKFGRLSLVFRAKERRITL